MRRTIISVAVLAVVGFWLFFTYGPSDWLPQFSYPSGMITVLESVGALGIVALIGLQVWVSWSTDRALTAPANRERVLEFNLSRGKEFFWTVLPLVLTVALAVMAWVVRV